MKKIAVAAAALILGFAAIPAAHAQKEAMGMFYEMQMAPKVCKWTDAASSKKLDDMIASQEKALGITSSDRATLMKAAEADLRADPSNCAKDGILRPMYDESVK